MPGRTRRSEECREHYQLPQKRKIPRCCPIAGEKMGYPLPANARTSKPFQNKEVPERVEMK
uniref:Uncharacterized protein n=1 Tax=Kuenenia stuttgartiensis TaxID=174633 RepID=Q1PVJ4_KUEST|nr:unknown protein [Candidatus Kuenenia stuttgartiensis]